MTDKRIKSYLEDRLKRLKSIRNKRKWTTAELGDAVCCKKTLSFIDSLQEEPVNEQNLSNVERTIKDWKEEPVSEDTMTIRKEWFEHCKESWYNEGYIDGKYNRDRQFEDSVSEDLEEEIDRAHRIFYDEVGWDSDEGARAYVADWFAHYFANWQKTQMIKNATEVTVHTDAGGYPYIPQMELYDYDNDMPLAKEGDRYKVVLIKED